MPGNQVKARPVIHRSQAGYAVLLLGFLLALAACGSSGSSSQSAEEGSPVGLASGLNNGGGLSGNGLSPTTIIPSVDPGLDPTAFIGEFGTYSYDRVNASGYFLSVGQIHEILEWYVAFMAQHPDPRWTNAMRERLEGTTFVEEVESHLVFAGTDGLPDPTWQIGPGNFECIVSRNNLLDVLDFAEQQYGTLAPEVLLQFHCLEYLPEQISGATL